MEIESYPDCLAHLQKQRRVLNLLMGNGFSMAYDNTIFSYNALHDFIDKLDDPVLPHLFKIVNSKNLEVIMRQLDVLKQLLHVFGGESGLRADVDAADAKLRQGLLDAVQAMHPEHVFKVPETQIASCYNFMRPYVEGRGGIFTSNYDLLLYWVLMRSSCRNAIDGFGRTLENPEEEDPDQYEYSEELVWGPNAGAQNIHYLHGALHLFDNGIEIEKEQYDEFGYLLDNVKARMDKREYPVFVTAGSSADKLSQIMHNKYLEHCYSQFSSMEGSLITFGFNFGQYDEHIIDAINKAAHYGKKAQSKLYSLYIGVYSDSDAEYIRSISKKFRCKVHLFDSTSAAIWNG